jgi:hypothetical protein
MNIGIKRALGEADQIDEYKNLGTMQMKLIQAEKIVESLAKPIVINGNIEASIDPLVYFELKNTRKVHDKL